MEKPIRLASSSPMSLAAMTAAPRAQDTALPVGIYTCMAASPSSHVADMTIMSPNRYRGDNKLEQRRAYATQ